MRIVTWNVASLPPTARNIELAHKSLAAFFKNELAADVVCLQEVKLSSDKLTKELVCVDGYESYWATSDERKGYSGVTTWCRAAGWGPHSAESNCLPGCREGRIVVTYHGAIAIVNVYVPNAGDRGDDARLAYKLGFLSALKDKLDALAASGLGVICVGDFNVAPHKEDAYFPVEDYDPSELAAMRGMMEAFPDVWRRLHPGEAERYTVWDMKTSARAFNRGARIDFVLVSPALLPHVTSCEIRYDLPKSWSDHVPLVCDITLDTPPPRNTPCKEWTALQRRFVDPRQRSIASMFGARKGGGSTTSGGSDGPKAATPVGQQQQQQQQQQQPGQQPPEQPKQPTQHQEPEQQQEQQHQHQPGQQQVEGEAGQQSTKQDPEGQRQQEERSSTQGEETAAAGGVSSPPAAKRQRVCEAPPQPPKQQQQQPPQGKGRGGSRGAGRGGGRGSAAGKPAGASRDPSQPSMAAFLARKQPQPQSPAGTE